MTPWILPSTVHDRPLLHDSTVNQSITRFCNQRCSLARIRSLRTHLKMGSETSHPKKAQSDLKIAHIRISRVTYVVVRAMEPSTRGIICPQSELFTYVFLSWTIFLFDLSVLIFSYSEDFWLLFLLQTEWGIVYVLPESISFGM